MSRKRNHANWTEAELAEVRDAYAMCDGTHGAAWALIEDRLPGRTRHAVSAKGQQLGVSLGRRAPGVSRLRYCGWGGDNRAAGLQDPPTPLPWGEAPPPCPHCGRMVPARRLGSGVWLGTTQDGDYSCLSCGTVQMVGRAPATRRSRR